MKYFASKKLEIKSFEFSKIFSSFIILKCRNSSHYLNFCIDWHKIFFFNSANLQASQNERNLNFLIFISDCESLNNWIMLLMLKCSKYWCHVLIDEMIYEIDDDMINVIFLLNKKHSIMLYDIVSNQNEIFCFWKIKNKIIWIF